MNRLIWVGMLAAAMVFTGCAEEQVTTGEQDTGGTNVPYTGGNPAVTPTTSTTPTTTGPAEGTDGGSCYANGTCQGDLICVDNVCGEKPAGGLDGPCFGNGTCNEGLVCVDGLCKEPASQPQGGAGGECYPNGTCNQPNECENGVCVPPMCKETSCNSDIECALCEDAKVTCLLSENRCVACDPNTNAGCESWESCTSNGVCEEVAAPCPTTEDGTPTISCTSNLDCAGCSPMHKVCDLEDNRCKACTDTNTQNCLATDVCIEGVCSAKCPHECTADLDCSQCEVKGIEAKACYAHKCAECSETYPCPAGKNCINGVCVPACGLPGAVAGTCSENSDCVYCGGNSSGAVTSASWTCNKKVVNGTQANQGTCGPPAAGCSDLGQSVVVLPDPWNQYTQTCSNNTDCKGVGINYNVGQLLRDLVGDSVMGVDIEDAVVLYEMNVCATVDINSDTKCGICVPCAQDSDCNPIDLDPLLFDLLGDNIIAQVAVQFLLNQLFPEENEAHNLYFFCEPVAAGYGVCAPCTNPSQACSTSGTSSSGTGEGGGSLPTTDSCDHSVCEEGAALGSNCGTCEAAVCGADAFCCETTWDSLCVSAVEDHCTLSCTGGGTTGGTEGGQPVDTCHDPCVEGDALNPDCGTCAASVCSQDPFCCNTNWDNICVGIAQSIIPCACPGGTEGGGSTGGASGGGISGGEEEGGNEEGGAESTCFGNCGIFVPGASCACDDSCVEYDDCCEDRCIFCPTGEGCGGASEDFTCNNGEVIDGSWVCDGDEDCNSGEDEENCNN